VRQHRRHPALPPGLPHRQQRRLRRRRRQLRHADRRDEPNVRFLLQRCGVLTALAAVYARSAGPGRTARRACVTTGAACRTGAARRTGAATRAARRMSTGATTRRAAGRTARARAAPARAGRSAARAGMSASATLGPGPATRAGMSARACRGPARPGPAVGRVRRQRLGVAATNGASGESQSQDHHCGPFHGSFLVSD
jgi:hypothetical protein